MKAESIALVINSTNIWQFIYIGEGYKISPLLGVLQDQNFVFDSDDVIMAWLILCGGLNENFKKPRSLKQKEKNISK